MINNSAADCSISVKFSMEFYHMTSDVMRTFKVKCRRSRSQHENVIWSPDYRSISGNLGRWNLWLYRNLLAPVACPPFHHKRRHRLTNDTTYIGSYPVNGHRWHLTQATNGPCERPWSIKVDTTNLLRSRVQPVEFLSAEVDDECCRWDKILSWWHQYCAIVSWQVWSLDLSIAVRTVTPEQVAVTMTYA